VAAHEKIPLDAFGGVPVGFDAGGAHLAIEKEGKLQGEDAGFSAAIVSPQKQAAVGIVELLLIVPVEVEHSAAQRLPALAVGRGE